MSRNWFYIFPLTTICVALIWYFCLFRPPHVSLFEGIPNFDKVVHATMYCGTCSVFWFEYYIRRTQWSKFKRFIIAVASPIIMSGIIELAQEYLTTYRSGDWADVLANSIGVLLALISMCIFKHHLR